MIAFFFFFFYNNLVRIRNDLYGSVKILLYSISQNIWLKILKHSLYSKLLVENTSITNSIFETIVVSFYDDISNVFLMEKKKKIRYNEGKRY